MSGLRRPPLIFDQAASATPGSGPSQEGRNPLRDIRPNFSIDTRPTPIQGLVVPMHSDKDLDRAVKEAVRKTEAALKKRIEELTASTAAHKRKVEETEAACKEKIAEMEAAHKKKLQERENAHKKKLRRSEGTMDKKVKDTEATYKRKIFETFKCVVCLNIAKEGQILQCQNGDPFCEGCVDSNKNSCPKCKMPLDQLTGKKRIRVLVIEQLIEAVELEFPCKHANCQVIETRGRLIEHEKKCEFRSVPCPDGGCSREIPFFSLLGHMENGSHLLPFTSGVVMHAYEIPAKTYTAMSCTWPSSIANFQDNTFVVALAKVEGIYYTYMRLLGNMEDSKMFKVTISIGGGTQSGILHHGQIFPIDMKESDILKEHSGVLSFTSVGMGNTFFQDQIIPENGKNITIQYKISKVANAAEESGFDVSSRVEFSGNGLQLTEWMAN